MARTCRKRLYPFTGHDWSQLNTLFPPVTQFFLIGKTLKSHGTGGQLRLLIEDHLKSYIKKGTYIFLDLDGSKIPFKIADVNVAAHFVIDLEDVTDKKNSDQLSGLDIWIPLAVVHARHQRSPKNLKDKWNEYVVEDTVGGNVYKIIRVEEYPQQLMAVVVIENREVLIPLSDALISEIDRSAKIIRMQIPEGLLDL